MRATKTERELTGAKPHEHQVKAAAERAVERKQAVEDRITKIEPAPTSEDGQHHIHVVA